MSSGVAQASASYNIYADERWGPITISVPPLGGSTPSGQGAVAQVIATDSDDDLTSAGVNYVDVEPNGNGGFMALPLPALDKDFPFPFGYSLDANGHMTVSAGSSAFSAPGTGYSGDQPKIQIFPDSTSNWTSSNLSIHFGTWVMYQPKGGIWVPLQLLTWNCADTAVPSPGGPIVDPAGGPNWAAPPQLFNGGTPADTPNYPLWVGSSAGSSLGVPSPH